MAKIRSNLDSMIRKLETKSLSDKQARRLMGSISTQLVESLGKAVDEESLGEAGDLHERYIRVINSSKYQNIFKI